MLLYGLVYRLIAAVLIHAVDRRKQNKRPLPLIVKSAFGGGAGSGKPAPKRSAPAMVKVAPADTKSAS